jgi:hypothetical protein
VGADLRVPREGTPAIEAGSQGSRSRRTSWSLEPLFSPIPVEKIEGEKNDEDKKNADGPEETLHKGVPVFLGVKEDPEGHDERNDVNEDKKEAHPGISPKKLMADSSWQKKNRNFSSQLSAFSCEL